MYVCTPGWMYVSNAWRLPEALEMHFRQEQFKV